MSGVLVFGDITVDLLAKLPADPVFGADNLTPEVSVQCGGVGANAAVALARWGVPVRLLGCAGRDPFGDFALQFIASQGVDTSLVQRNADSATGIFFIGVSPGGQRTIFGSRGANALCAAPPAGCLDGTAAVLLEGYNFLSPSATAAAERLLAEARKRGVRVALDAGAAPCQQMPKAILQAARNVHTLFVGIEEAKALTGKRRKEAALGAIAGCGAREILVKLGAGGALLLMSDNFQEEVPPFPVKAVDTTGAGDAFAAAYLYGTLRWDFISAALLASAAGAAASMTLGTAEAMPRPAQVLEVLEKTKVHGPFREAHWELRKKLHGLLDVRAQT